MIIHFIYLSVAYQLLLVSIQPCVGVCVRGSVEPTGELPVNKAQTDSTAAVADADTDDKSLSPTQRYVSYDDRPLPAIRRFLLAVSSLTLLHK